MGGKAHLLFRYLLLVCLSLCLVLPGIALGQDEEDEEMEFMLEEIIVTSEKREAEVQSIPMEIDVVREQEMRMLNINRIYDIEKMIPDLSVTTDAGSYNLISIREVRTNLPNPIYETTVAMHVDGINLTKVIGLDNFFFDLERFEVMKGPQGTLYGRGSTAGAINLITRKPILGEFSGNVSIEGGNYGRIRGDWALNVPLGEKMAMRLAGRRYLFDGYGDAGYGDSDSHSHRLSWRYEPDDRITFNMMVDYIKADDNGRGHIYIAEGYYFDSYGDVEIVAAPAGTPGVNVVAPQYQSGGPVRSRWKTSWAVGDVTARSGQFDSEMYGTQGSASYEGDVVTATLEWGHRVIHEYKPVWMGGASLATFPPFVNQTQAYVNVRTPTQFYFVGAHGNTNTAELRFTSNKTIAAGDKVEWLIGAMAQRDRIRQTPCFFACAPGDWWYDVMIRTHTEGLFGRASWRPFEKWEFTGGVRYNSDAKFFYGNTSDRGFPVYDYYTIDAKWTEYTYRANISYFPTDNIMPFLTYARGYKTGNINYYAGIIPPELVNDWEFGIKSRFLDNRLQINAIYYFYDYENYSDQADVNSCWEDDNGDHECDDVTGNPDDTSNPLYPNGYPPYDPAVGTRYPDDTVNQFDFGFGMLTGFSAGPAEQKGISVNIQYLPTMDDRLSLAAVWRNNKYVSPYDPKAALLALFPDADSPYRQFSDNSDLGGKEFGGAPIRGNVSYSHTFRFGGGDTLMARGTAFYEGEGIDQYVNNTWPNEYTMPGRDAYWTFDASLVYNSSRWMSHGNLWSLRFSVQNIFDSDDLYSIMYTDDYAFFSDAYPFRSGIITGRYIDPRTYSLTFAINF